MKIPSELLSFCTDARFFVQGGVFVQSRRDHWPKSFSAMLAGGGIKGGQVIGDTGPDGASIKERPVTVPQFLATICQALGIDH